MRVELTTDLSLTREEQTLLSMHSVLNVLNTTMFEVRRLRDILGERPEMEEAEDVIMEVADDLRDAERTQQHLAAAEKLAARLTELVSAAVSAADGTGAGAEIAEIRANLESIFRILRIRAEELVAREENPEAWIEHRINELKRNFLEVFAAIEKNSRGGYRIVFNVAAHEEGDYFVDFDITSFRGDVIHMPAVLQDVMRDLIANARKYTPPGGRILAGLHENEDRLRFVVEDNGRGIPADEIAEVAAFGERGSNVQDRPTRGGGFGLTKALYNVRRFDGRMWIDSDAGTGTRIEIELPQPT